MIAPKEHKLFIFEVPHCEPMEKSATGKDMSTLQSEAVVKVRPYGEKFLIFGSGAKNAFQTISRTLAILTMVTLPPYIGTGRHSHTDP